MSDIGEKGHQDTGRPAASTGMTKGSSLSSGLSEHSQIKDSMDDIGMGHGQGERPSGYGNKSMSHGGRKFKTK